jgi:chitodextrinase
MRPAYKWNLTHKKALPDERPLIKRLIIFWAVPPEVTDLINTNVTSTSIALSWSSPDTECDITGYNVSYYGEILWGDGGWVNSSKYVNGSQEYVEIDGLTPHTQYTITVVASTEEGPGLPSENLSITTDEACENSIQVKTWSFKEVLSFG